MNGHYNNEQATALVQFQQQLRRYRRRRLIAVGVVVLGVVVLLQHWVHHLGVTLPLGLSPRWQDLLIGYPMGAALLLAGLVLRGRRM